jgi:phage terminase large subunit GpA-like protein
VSAYPSARAIVAGALAAILEPPNPIAASQWAAENFIVPDGARAGGAWDLSLTPYIVEPLDNIGPESPVNEEAVRKAAQTGFTIMLLAAIGHSIDRDPCRMMVIQPTDGALSEFNREKLQPAIDGTKALKHRVIPQTSRSAQGSTTYSKKYPGGSLTLCIASSAAALRSATIKKLFRDEIDQYPDDLEGQGDPLDISDARLTNFLAQGEWKKVDISTPTIVGSSKIQRRFEQGDKRFWHVKCPHCGEEFRFEWGPNFRYNREFPHQAHYITPCCGVVIAAYEKIGLVRNGRWIASDPRPGAFPSYHFDALSSPFVPWDETAKKFVEAGDDQRKLTSFYNLFLGLPFEVKGDAPDHMRLMERREEGFVRGQIPPRGLLLIASADVQMRGIWVEVVAFAPNRESFVVDQDYLDGSTEAVDGEAFEKLRTRILDREYPDAFGGKRRLDGLAVDSGYRSHIVYAWARKNQRLHPDSGQDVVFAVNGLEGWGRPALGTPKLVDIDLAGHRVKKGCKLWPVGTWPLKGAFYADLNKEGVRSGKPVDPEGYCHFPTWLDEAYFRQITSEYLAQKTERGKTRQFWQLRSSERDNHLLDCRIYSLAIADKLALSSYTQDDWAALAKARGMPPDDALALFKPRAAEADKWAVAAASPAPQAAAPAAPDKKLETASERFARLAKANAELFR